MSGRFALNFKNEAERFLRLANGEKFEHAVWERQEGRVLRKVFSFIDEIFDDLDGFSVIEVDEESDDLAIAICFLCVLIWIYI